MASQIIDIVEESENKQNETPNYIAIPLDSLNVSNQEFQALLCQNIILKPLAENKFSIVDNAQEAVRPSVIEYNRNNDQNNTIFAIQTSTSIDSNAGNVYNNKPTQSCATIKNQTKEKKQQFECKVCKARFKNVENYQYHVENSCHTKKYKCEQCSASYNIQDNFKIHMAMHNKGEPTCPLCKRKFQRLASLKSHLLLHQTEEVFTCNECLSEFENEDQFNSHIASHSRDLSKEKNRNVSRSCNYCKVSFDSYQQYREHISHHIKVNRLLLTNVRRNRRKTNTHQEYAHKCDVCKKSFPKISLLRRHFRIHSGEKPFVCEECNRGFAQKGTLQIHMTRHTGVKPYACTLCPARFCQKGNLRAHVEKTHMVPNPGEEVFKCTLCSCVFKKIASLNGHITKVHSGQKYDDISAVLFQLKELERQANGKAVETNNKGSKTVKQSLDVNLNSVQTTETRSEDTTGFKYVTSADSSISGAVKCYVVKQRKNGDIRWYMCSYCTKEFKKPSDLIRHIRVHTREKPFPCEICGQSFSLKSTLSTHINTHIFEKQYKCKTCGRNFSSAKMLYNHERKHERGESEKDLQQDVRENVRQYRCDICKNDLTFKNELEFQNHMETHKNSQVVSTINTNELSITLRPPMLLTPQGLLPIVTTKSRNLKSLTDENRPYTCTVCSAAFFKKVHLKRHFLTHTGERKFKCDICPKSFYTKYAKREHLKFHYNIKNYSCKVCGKRFVTSALLKRHLVTHSSVRPYVCPNCNKRFKTLPMCRKHILTHSTQRPYGCPYCEKKYKTSSLCKLHIKTHGKEADKNCIIASFGEVNSTGENVILKINTDQNQHSTNRSNTANIDGMLTDTSQVVAAGIYFANDEGADTASILPQIDKNNSIEQCIANNSVLENDSMVPMLYVDYDDMQLRLLPNLNFLNADFSQIKDFKSLSISEEQNAEISNVLLSVDPVLNQEIQNGFHSCNEEPLLSTDDLQISASSTVSFTKQNMTSSSTASADASQSEPKSCEKSITNENMANITLPNNINLFESEVLPDYIEINPTANNLHKNDEYFCVSCRYWFRNSTNETQNKASSDGAHSLTHENEGAMLAINPSDPQAEKQQHTSLLCKMKKNSLHNFQCPFCFKTFNKRNLFLKHQEFHRKKELNKILENKCNFCSKKFKKPSDLIRHLRTHTGERPFKCTQCDKSFSLKSTLDTHYRTHKPGGHKEFNCPVCNSYFSSKSSLKVHMLLHTGAKPYQCPLCPLKFRTSGHKQMHLKKHTKENRKNEETSKAKRLKYIENLTNDINLIGAPPGELGGISANEATMPVNMDNINFENRNNKGIENSDQQQELNNVKTIEMDSFLYQLELDGSYLQDQGNGIPVSFIQLDDDNLLKITSTSNEKFTTSISDVLLTESSVQKQQNITQDIVTGATGAQAHLNKELPKKDQEFVCSMCKKKLKTLKVLKKHMKLHEKKKHICDKCTKAYESEKELEEHSQLHNGIKRFCCQFCSNSFDTEANLKTHMKRMHAAFTSEFLLTSLKGLL